MPYYCQFNGTGYLTANTLGNLITANKVRIFAKKVTIQASTSYLFSQAGSGTREFGILYNSGLQYRYGGASDITILNSIEMNAAFGTSPPWSCDSLDFVFDNVASTLSIYKDGSPTPIKTVTTTRGTNRIDGMLFRIGARGNSDTPTDTGGAVVAVSGVTIGDFDVYINDVLVRQYITPASGTTIPDSIGGNTLTQRGTWPTDNSEWVFYSSGASNTLSVSATLPKITGSLTLNEINPSYVISVSGQLPKITGAVALNEINPVFTVAVAGQLPKLAGSIALNQFANNRQVTVSGVLPKLTGAVTLNRIQPNNQAAVSGQLPRITASITLRVPDSYPTANPNDYTVAAYLSTDTTINAIIRAETTYAARLN